MRGWNRAATSARSFSRSAEPGRPPGHRAGVEYFCQEETLGDGREKRVFHLAVADHVAPAGHRAEIAREAEPRLLDAARAAGDGQHVGLPARVGLEKSLFHHAC